MSIIFTMKMTHKPPWIPASTGMTEEGHLSFYFRGDKQSFLPLPSQG